MVHHIYVIKNGKVGLHGLSALVMLSAIQGHKAKEPEYAMTSSVIKKLIMIFVKGLTMILNYVANIVC